MQTKLISFSQQLAEYQQQIDADIAQYAKSLRSQTLNEYGANAYREIDAYLQILERGGKRIRGALAMNAYAMCGGTNETARIMLARAIEMIHAYILIIDDIQDRSAIRRSGPTAHIMLAEYHRKEELGGDADHFGVSIALNAALSGAHLAQQIIAQLPIDEATRLRIITQINSTMVTTAHGQSSDIVSEVVAEVSMQDIEQILELKTAHYTFMSPIALGLMLAGADDKDVAQLKSYALYAGRAFQITDDILGTFGSEFESGKSPMDDVREGKRTVLIAHALTHTTASDKNFLVRMLGKKDITPVEFERTKHILLHAGSLDYAKQLAKNDVARAVEALNNLPATWRQQNVKFLRDLAAKLLDRKS